MATPAGRATYSGWLDQIAQQGRTDDYGRVAAGWLNAQPNGRPKYHAPKSVNRWLSEHPPPGVVNLQATLHQLEQHYHQQAALPGDPAITAPQQPDPAAEQQQDWFASPEGQAWLASPDGQAWIASQHVSAGQEPVQETLYPAPGADELHPEQPAEDPDAQVWGYLDQQPPDQPWQQQGPPENPQQVIMLMIGRLEAKIDAFWQAMAPLVQLASETLAVDTAIATSQLASPAQLRAQQIAREQGWTPGPEIPQPVAPPQAPDFYGGHVVAQPNFGAMADASDGIEDTG